MHFFHIFTLKLDYFKKTVIKEQAAKGLMFETGCVSQNNWAGDSESMGAVFLNTFQGQYCT
jgi:hypothetical protein